MCHRCGKNTSGGSLHNSPYVLDVDTSTVLRMVWVSLLLFLARPRETLGRDVGSSCARTLAMDASPLPSYRPLSFYFRGFLFSRSLSHSNRVKLFGAIFWFRKNPELVSFQFCLSMFKIIPRINNGAMIRWLRISVATSVYT